MADLDSEIVRAAATIREEAGKQYGVSVYAGDLPDPGSVTPTEYARSAHILALAMKMAEIKRDERIAREEAEAKEKTEGEEPEEPEGADLGGKVMSVDDIRKVYEEEEAAFEVTLSKRHDALNPALKGKVVSVDEAYEAHIAQQKALKEQKEAKK